MRPAYAAVLAAKRPCDDCDRELHGFEQETRGGLTLCVHCAADRDRFDAGEDAYTAVFPGGSCLLLFGGAA